MTEEIISLEWPGPEEFTRIEDYRSRTVLISKGNRSSRRRRPVHTPYETRLHNSVPKYTSEKF